MEFVFAYIDPGSGSLLIQGLIATMVAVPIFFRHQIARAVNAIRGKSTTEPVAAPTSDETTTPPQA
jgi:hypothetical protein